MFLPESELSEVAKGSCADEDRRYLFPFDARGTWPVAHSGRRDGEAAGPELPWGGPASAASPDDHAAGWCGWYWGEAGAWMWRDFEEGTSGWMRKGPAAYLQAETAQRRAAL